MHDVLTDNRSVGRELAAPSLVLSPASSRCAAAFRSRVASLDAQGRKIGAVLDSDPAQAKQIMPSFPISAAMNTIGAPAEFEPIPFVTDGSDRLMGANATERCIIFETLASVDLNLIFSAPGPAMSGMLMRSIGSPGQSRRFYERFAEKMTWTSFALTERATGSDAMALACNAVAVADGFELTGQKYLIGGGAVADMVVVFARYEGAVRAFLVEAKELQQTRLELFGLRGANLGHLELNASACPADGLLGAHLPRLQLMAASASNTLEGLRPAIGAAALGSAMGCIERAEAEGLASASLLENHKNRIGAARAHLFHCAAAYDADELHSGQSGLAKTLGVDVATAAMRAVLSLNVSWPVDAPWMLRAWRNLRALEYTEGVAAIHKITGGHLFRATRGTA